MKRLLVAALFAAALIPGGVSVSSAGTATAGSDTLKPADTVAAKCHRYAHSAFVRC
jgi:hypothetical protein